MATLLALERRLDKATVRVQRLCDRRRPRAPLSAVALSRQAGIEPDDWQARVLTSPAPRLLLCASRQSGKSTTVATLAVHTALSAAGALVLLVSPGLRQSGELFKKCLAVYRGAGRPVPASSETALSLTLDNGSRIVSLPGNENTTRGYSGVTLLVIDEAAFVRNDLYASLRPVLAVSQGRLVALSTPHGTRGWWYEAWTGPESWERYEVPATACPRITPGFLAEERRSLGDWWFEQEYLCRFLDARSQAFSVADIAVAFSAEVEQWPNLLTAA